MIADREYNQGDQRDPRRGYVSVLTARERHRSVFEGFRRRTLRRYVH